MPNIREFQTPNLGIQPTETGVEGFAAAGRRAGAFFNQAGQSIDTLGQRIGGAIRDVGDATVKIEDHREISAGAATFAALTDAKNNEWNEIAKHADPNDPRALTSAAKQFREENLEPALDKWSSGFYTENAQRFAESRKDDYRRHVFEKTSADIASHAADAVHANVEMTANKLGNTVYNDPSPHNLDLALRTSDASISALADSSGMTAAQASRVKTEIGLKTKEHLVRSAIEGAIAKGAPYEQIMNDPKYQPYVNQQEIDQFAREAKRQQREDQIQSRQMQLLQKQEAESNLHTGISNAISNNEGFDKATGKTVYGPDTIPQLQAVRAKLKDSGINTKPVGDAIKWIESQQQERREPIVSDPATLNDLDTRMFSAENPTTAIDVRKAEWAGKISAHDRMTRLNLLKELEDKPLTGPIWRDTIESVKGVLGTDPKGHEAFGKFVQEFIPAYQRMSRAGTLPPNALDVRDPNSMISQAMSSYRRDPMQMMMDRRAHGLLTPEMFAPPTTPSKALAPPVKAATPQDAAKLNPGTRYITPDGKIYVR